MKSPNKPDVLEEIERILIGFATECVSEVYESHKLNKKLNGSEPERIVFSQAKQQILNWHKSQVKELVDEIKTNIKKYNADEKLLKIVDEALIDKLGEN